MLAPVEAKKLSSKCDDRLVRYKPPKLVFLNDYLSDDNQHNIQVQICHTSTYETFSLSEL